MIGDIFQPTHLLFILVVALLVLGPKRLPEAGRALGRGIRDFRMAMSGEDHDHAAITTDASAASAPPHTPAPPPEAYAPPPAPAYETAEPPVAPAATSAPASEPSEPATQPTERAHSVG
jgi:sec-independent protein translocase protein TatA